MKQFFRWIWMWGVAFFSTGSVFAQEESGFPGIIPKGESGSEDIIKQIGWRISQGEVKLSDIPFIIIHLIDLLTKVAGTIAVIFVLYASFQLMTSGLTEDRESAKNTLQYAAIGLVISLLAWVIVNVIQVQMTA
ncbi:pilin [Candidatus Gracilibacteria bacterium]|nr:pilin [Candidatus Gracilibacteria bacterium]MCF7819096.1 pilin [Candidatus Gracilibacteria bacterium]